MINLAADEKVIFEVRRHWLVFIFEVVFYAVLVAIPFATVAIFDLTNVVSLAPQVLPLLMFFSFAWVLILWIFFFVAWTNYYLDVWIITNDRIIDIEQHTLFSRDVSECRLDKVQDVTVEIHGFLPTFLHFGTLHVQTAGESNRFTIRDIPHPDRVKEIIFDAHESYMTHRRNQNSRGNP